MQAPPNKLKTVLYTRWSKLTLDKMVQALRKRKSFLFDTEKQLYDFTLKFTNEFPEDIFKILWQRLTKRTYYLRPQEIGPVEGRYLVFYALTENAEMIELDYQGRIAYMLDICTGRKYSNKYNMSVEEVECFFNFVCSTGIPAANEVLESLPRLSKSFDLQKPFLRKKGNPDVVEEAETLEDVESELKHDAKEEEVAKVFPKTISRKELDAFLETQKMRLLDLIKIPLRYRRQIEKAHTKLAKKTEDVLKNKALYQGFLNERDEKELTKEVLQREILFPDWASAEFLEEMSRRWSCSQAWVKVGVIQCIVKTNPVLHRRARTARVWIRNWLRRSQQPLLEEEVSNKFAKLTPGEEIYIDTIAEASGLPIMPCVRLIWDFGRSIIHVNVSPIGPVPGSMNLILYGGCEQTPISSLIKLIKEKNSAGKEFGKMKGRRIELFGHNLKMSSKGTLGEYFECEHGTTIYLKIAVSKKKKKYKKNEKKVV